MTAIATAHAADIPGVQALVEAMGLFPAELLPELIAPALAGAASDLWLVAHQQGIAGLAHTVPEPMTEGTWNMRALGVHPRMQGQGIGAMLVEATEQHLRANHARLLLVDTSGSAAFERARAFYQTVGYAEVACIPDYWAQGDAKVTFAKAL